MENLLEKNLLRHFRILRFLLYRGWITIGELSSRLQIPPRTIRQSIGEINEYIYPAKIESSQQFGIRLTYGPEFNSFYIYSSVYKQSIHFLILEEIFIHNYENSFALAEKLFISQSTLKRKILTINQVLRQQGFVIDLKKMDLLGEEHKIYFFYYSYLIEKYGVLDMLVPDLELKLIDELIESFTQYFPAVIIPKRQIYSYRNKIRIMLFINFKRIKKGHLLAGQLPNAECPTFPLPPLLQKKIAAYYQVDCCEKVIYSLFYFFLRPEYAWSNTDLEWKAQQNPAIAQVREWLLNYFAEIEAEEQLTMSNKAEILVYLYNATNYIAGSTKILYNPNEEFFVNLNDYYADFTVRIKQRLIDRLFREPLAIYLDETVTDQLMFMLITSWQGLMEQLEKKAPKVRVGIFFNTSFEHSHYLLNSIDYHLRSRLELELVAATTLKELRALASTFDLLITNLSQLELPDCNLISIQSNPTPKDFEHIFSRYNELIDQKAGQTDEMKAESELDLI